jgi:hypothetical protein
MPMYEDYEREMEANRRAQEAGGEVITCDCGSTYFVQVICAQYLSNQTTIIGQEAIPRPSMTPFIMLKCACCDKMHEPQVVRSGRDTMNKTYDNFLDMLEKYHRKIPSGVV